MKCDAGQCGKRQVGGFLDALDGCSTTRRVGRGRADHHHDFDEDANAGEGDFDGNGDEGKEQEIITNPPHQKEAQKRLSAEELEDSTAEREWTTSKVLF